MQILAAIVLQLPCAFAVSKQTASKYHKALKRVITETISNNAAKAIPTARPRNNIVQGVTSPVTALCLTTCSGYTLM
uniref:Secreted protein n=1 Tax=Timema bartmani TaxID=61472 RepID=A0A7R9F8W2_9NEOP|nr:unnamed protein product [Timema bartmani]